MLHVSKRVRWTALLLVLSGLSVAWSVACGGDDPATVSQSQTEQQSDAQASEQQAATEQQATGADQTQEATDQQQATAAQQAQPAQSQQQQTQPAQQSQSTAPSQQTQAEQPVGDDVLSDGARINGTIPPETTEQVYRLQIAAGAWWRISVDGLGSMDPVLTLLQPDGTEIARNDDLSTTNRDSLLIVQAPVEGLYYVRVEPYDSQSIGDFVVEARSWAVGADEDNAIISLGSYGDGRLDTPDDVDVFEFQVAEGQRVYVMVDGDTGVDVYSQMFDPNGNLIRTDDDSGHGLDAEFDFTADVDGLWRVEVWPTPNREGQRQLIGAYRVNVGTGSPTRDVDETTQTELSAAALTFLEALRAGDSATILALAGPEALAIWGWDDATDVERDVPKMRSIDLGGELLQTVAVGDSQHETRGRVYFQLAETDWLRFELIQLAGLWLVDDWAHSIGPPR